MKFRFASIILVLYSVVGIGVIVSSEYQAKAALNLLSYTFLYIIVPVSGAYGVWKQNLTSLIVSILFFSSQCIRVIGGGNWLPYAPPFSLGVPFGDFSDGQGYLVDYFAIFMVIYLAFLVKGLFTSNKPITKDT